MPVADPVISGDQVRHDGFGTFYEIVKLVLFNFGHCYLFAVWDLLFVIFQLVHFCHFSGLSGLGSIRATMLAKGFIYKVLQRRAYCLGR